MTSREMGDIEPPILLRILTFPLVRLPLLGGVLFVGMGISNGFMFANAGQPTTQLALVLLMVAAAVAIYAVFVRAIERRPVRELALRRAAPEFGFGLVLGFGLYAACVLVLMALGIYRIDGFNAWTFLLPMLPMAISSAVFEELIHRGVVFRIVQEYLGSWIALAVSALFFGLRHLGNDGATLLGALCITVEAGGLLAAAFMLTGRLWLPMGIHFSWNYAQASIFSGAVSGVAMPPGLIASTVEGPDILTGGAFGLESSLVALAVCTAAGVVLLVMTVRRGKVVPPSWPRGTH